MANNFINLNAVLNKDAKKYLDVVTEESAVLANHFVGKVAKNARSMAQQREKESGELNIGRGKHYFRKTTVANKGDKWSGMHTTESYWDSDTKAYRTKNAKASRKKRQKGDSGYLRLQNFSFTKGAGGKKRDDFKSEAEARLTSNLANLHERDVRFPKGSIMFSSGLMSPFRRFRAGQIRKGRHFFDEYSRAALSTLGGSATEALKQFDKSVWERTKGL